MISDACLDAYRKAFPNDTMAFFYETDGPAINIDGLTFYVPPEDETDQSFMDRLKRSEDQNKNLFLEEWNQIEADPNVEY